jgi:hypothetical protein
MVSQHAHNDSCSDSGGLRSTRSPLADRSDHGIGIETGPNMGQRSKAELAEPAAVGSGVDNGLVGDPRQGGV